MSYLKLDTMEYPLYEGDIRITHREIKQTQTGDTFPVPEGYAFVNETAQPTDINDDQYITIATPVQINGEWFQSWTVNTFTPEELEAIAKVREAEREANKKPVPMSVDVDGAAPNVIE